MSGSAAFDPNAPYSVVPPAAQAPAASFDPSAPYSVYPMAPTAPVAGQAGTYSNLPAQDVAPFQAGQGPAPGQGVAPPTVAPPQASPSPQAPGPTLTITPDQAPPTVPGAALAPTAQVPQLPPAPSPQSFAPQTPDAGPSLPPAPQPQSFADQPAPPPAPPAAAPAVPSLHVEQGIPDDQLKQFEEAGAGGMTFGWSPEIASAVAAALPGETGGSQLPSFAQRYAANLAIHRASYAAIPPSIKLAGNLAGMAPVAMAGAAASGAIPGVNALSGIVSDYVGPTVARYLGYSAAGAAQGAAQGSADAGPGNRLEGAGRGAALGGTVGAVLPAAGELGMNALHAIGRYAAPIFGKVGDLVDEAGNSLGVGSYKPAVQRAVGEELNTAARAQQPEVLDQLAKGSPQGQNLTSGQLTGNKPILQLERKAALNPNNVDAFKTRQEGQTQAQLGQARSLGTGEDSLTAVQHVQAARQALEDTNNQMQAAAARAVPAATDRVGGTAAATDQGRALRAGPAQHFEGDTQAEGMLHNAVDPDGTLMMDARPIPAGARRIEAETSKNEKIGAEEKEIFSLAKSQSSLSSYRDIAALSKRITTRMRQARIEGEGQELRRLTMLKGDVESAIDGTIERRAASDPAITSRLEAMANGTDGRATEPNGGRGLSGQNQAGGVVTARGTGGEGQGGSGSPPVNRRLAAMAPNAGASRVRSGPSLLTFLSRRGGLNKDQSVYRGELGQIFDKAPGPVGLLRRTTGNTLDHAREMAEEAGYLKPGSDINDLLNAITQEHGGDKVFPQHIAADRAIQAQHDANMAAHENAAAGAREDVRMSADDAGIKLTPEEIEHATNLTMGGYHADDAVQAVAQDGDARTMTLEAARAQPRGLPGASQSELATEAGQGGVPTFDAAAQGRLAQARAATIAKHQRFDGKVGSALLASGPTKGTFALSDASVPAAVVKAGATGRQALDEFANMGGSMEAARDTLAARARDMAVGKDGMLNTGSLDRFRKAYAESLSHPAMAPLKTALGSAEKAQDEFERVTAQAKANVAGFDKSAAARLAGLTGRSDVSRTVGEMLGSKRATTMITQLRAQLGNNQAAVDGVKQAVADHIMDHFVSQREIGTGGQGMVKAEAFKQFLLKNREALGQFFSPSDLNAWDRLADFINKTARSETAIKIGVGSETGQLQKLVGSGKEAHSTIMQIVRHAWAPASSTAIGATAGAAAGETAIGLLGGVGLGIGLAAVRALRMQGMAGFDDLMREALLHPQVAHVLMARATPETVSRLVKGLQHVVARATAVDLAGQANSTGEPP